MLVLEDRSDTRDMARQIEHLGRWLGWLHRRGPARRAVFRVWSTADGSPTRDRGWSVSALGEWTAGGVSAVAIGLGDGVALAGGARVTSSAALRSPQHGPVHHHPPPTTTTTSSSHLHTPRGPWMRRRDCGCSLQNAMCSRERAAERRRRATTIWEKSRGLLSNPLGLEHGPDAA